MVGERARPYFPREVRSHVQNCERSRVQSAKIGSLIGNLVPRGMDIGVRRHTSVSRRLHPTSLSFADLNLKDQNRFPGRGTEWYMKETCSPDFEKSTTEAIFWISREIWDFTATYPTISWRLQLTRTISRLGKQSVPINILTHPICLDKMIPRVWRRKWCRFYRHMTPPETKNLIMNPWEP